MFTRHVDRLLTRYGDGDLSAADRQRVDAHLARCGRCRAALDEIRFSTRLVRHLTAVSAPPSIWRNIDAALTGPERASRAPVVLQWAAACALVLGIAVGAYWWTREAVGGPTGGRWHVRVEQAGEYELTLRRWPEQTKAALGAAYEPKSSPQPKKAKAKARSFPTIAAAKVEIARPRAAGRTIAGQNDAPLVAPIVRCRELER